MTWRQALLEGAPRHGAGTAWAALSSVPRWPSGGVSRAVPQSYTRTNGGCPEGTAQGAVAAPLRFCSLGVRSSAPRTSATAWNEAVGRGDGGSSRDAGRSWCVSVRSPTRPRVHSGSLRYAPVVCQAPARAQRCGCESQTPLGPWGLSLVRTREAPWLCLGGQVSEKAAWRR